MSDALDVLAWVITIAVIVLLGDVFNLWDVVSWV